MASDNLTFAFEKEDAKDKWGQENVFAAALRGRSLRYTAIQIYGSEGPARGDPQSRECTEIHKQVDKIQKRVFKSCDSSQWCAKQFEDVGGIGPWRYMYMAMPEPETYSY